MLKKVTKCITPKTARVQTTLKEALESYKSVYPDHDLNNYTLIFIDTLPIPVLYKYLVENNYNLNNYRIAKYEYFYNKKNEIVSIDIFAEEIK